MEAIDDFEDADMEVNGHEPYYTVGELAIFRDHVVEEMGDVLIRLTQFLARYDIKKYELDVWMDSKLDRTKYRIRTGYYEKQDK